MSWVPLKKLLWGHGVDGIFIAGKMNVEMIEKIRSWEVPLVVLGHLMYRDPLEDELDQVIVDSLDYSYRCTKMLIEQGAEEIALVNGPSYQVFSDSTQGYMKALNEAGRKFDEQKVINCAEDNALFAERKFSKWLDGQNIDGVFAAGENLQIGVRQALWNSGRSDIMLASVSYGALKSSANCCLLKISASRIASEAVDLIGRKLANTKKIAETIKVSAK